MAILFDLHAWINRIALLSVVVGLLVSFFHKLFSFLQLSLKESRLYHNRQQLTIIQYFSNLKLHLFFEECGRTLRNVEHRNPWSSCTSWTQPGKVGLILAEVDPFMDRVSPNQFSAVEWIHGSLAQQRPQSLTWQKVCNKKNAVFFLCVWSSFKILRTLSL